MANGKPHIFVTEGILCPTVADTRRLGAELAETLAVGSVISLEGTLGAGKTQFAKGLAEGLGCPTEASSPSFALLHEYEGSRIPLFHFDFYRLEDPDELITAGYDDCLAEGATIVEWGNRFPGVLPPGTLRLRFEIMADGSRRITAEEHA